MFDSDGPDIKDCYLAMKVLVLIAMAADQVNEIVKLVAFG